MNKVLTTQEFEAILLKICTRETSQSPERWTADNPLWGHCAVVSLLAQDLFGGELLRASLEDNPEMGLFGSHYWNKFMNGSEYDFTIKQFYPKCPDRKKLKPVIRERSYLMSNADTARRYMTLVQRLNEFIG